MPRTKVFFFEKCRSNSSFQPEKVDINLLAMWRKWHKSKVEKLKNIFITFMRVREGGRRNVENAAMLRQTENLLTRNCNFNFSLRLVRLRMWVISMWKMLKMLNLVLLLFALLSLLIHTTLLHVVWAKPSHCLEWSLNVYFISSNLSLLKVLSTQHWAPVLIFPNLFSSLSFFSFDQDLHWKAEISSIKMKVDWISNSMESASWEIESYRIILESMKSVFNTINRTFCWHDFPPPFERIEDVSREISKSHIQWLLDDDNKFAKFDFDVYLAETRENINHLKWFNESLNFNVKIYATLSCCSLSLSWVGSCHFIIQIIHHETPLCGQIIFQSTLSGSQILECQFTAGNISNFFVAFQSVSMTDDGCSDRFCYTSPTFE